MTPNAHANGGRVSPLATDSVTFSVSNGVGVTPFRSGCGKGPSGECNGVTCARGHLLLFYRAAACSSQSLMRPRIAAALVRCSAVITALSVSQFSARSESWAAYTLWITDHAWVVSSGLRRPRAMAVSLRMPNSVARDHSGSI